MNSIKGCFVLWLGISSCVMSQALAEDAKASVCPGGKTDYFSKTQLEIVPLSSDAYNNASVLLESGDLKRMANFDSKYKKDTYKTAISTDQFSKNGSLKFTIEMKGSHDQSLPLTLNLNASDICKQGKIVIDLNEYFRKIVFHADPRQFFAHPDLQDVGLRISCSDSKPVKVHFDSGSDPSFVYLLAKDSDPKKSCDFSVVGEAFYEEESHPHSSKNFQFPQIPSTLEITALPGKAGISIDESTQKQPTVHELKH